MRPSLRAPEEDSHPRTPGVLMLSSNGIRQGLSCGPPTSTKQLHH